MTNGQKTNGQKTQGQKINAQKTNGQNLKCNFEFELLGIFLLPLVDKNCGPS